jgi:glyceraldehyde 3-phosphate dehydrogenase
MIAIAINGFGRIGRNFLRAVLSDKRAKEQLHIKAINVGPANPAYVAHMYKYDTLMGTTSAQVSGTETTLTIDDLVIPLLAESDPLALHWKKYDVDWVVDATGAFTNRERAQLHVKAGAKKVLITAPATDEDITVIPGVNDDQYDPASHTIVALGSCTTNAFIPLLKVLHENFDVKDGLMTTIHAYTNSQVLLDVEGEDLRRSRAAALNIIPTHTGVSRLIKQLIPSLKGSIKAMAVRVPVAKVSLIDFSFSATYSFTKEQINEVLINAAQEESLSRIIGVSHNELVSSDFSGVDYSIIVDTPLTEAAGSLGKVMGWYDNEWAFSVRLKDFLLQNSR